MPTVTVSSAIELKAALGTLVNGGVVLLRPGDYGDLDIRDFNPASVVTLSSTDIGDAAHLDTINVLRSSNIRFSNLDVGRPLNPGEPDYKNYIYAESATRLNFNNLFVHGSLDGDPGNDGQGLIVRNSSFINVVNSHFEDLHRAVAVSMTSNIVIHGNKITMISEDGIGFAQVKNVEVSNNAISNFQAIKNHPDAIQFGTTGTTESSQSIIIRDNVVMQGAGQPIQGLFMRDEIGTLPFKNVTVSNNLFYTDQYNGIVLQHAELVNIIGNSTLSIPDDGINNRIWLKDVNGAGVSHNVADSYIFSNVTGLYLDPDNIDLSRDGKTTLFPNLHAGATATVNDLLTTGGYHPDPQTLTAAGPVSSALGSSISNSVHGAGATGQSALVSSVAVMDPSNVNSESRHVLPNVPIHYPWMDHWQLA
jgi:hypothetical protein